MNNKSTQYLQAEKTGNLLAEKNTVIERQAVLIREFEKFAEKFLDNFKLCEHCQGKGSYTRNDIECGVCHGTGGQIDSVGILFVELPDEARTLLYKAQS